MYKFRIFFQTPTKILGITANNGLQLSIDRIIIYVVQI